MTSIYSYKPGGSTKPAICIADSSAAEREEFLESMKYEYELKVRNVARSNFAKNVMFLSLYNFSFLVHYRQVFFRAFCIRRKKKNLLFPETRPTLAFTPRP